MSGQLSNEIAVSPLAKREQLASPLATRKGGCFLYTSSKQINVNPFLSVVLDAAKSLIRVSSPRAISRERCRGIAAFLWFEPI